jgi:fucose permease
MRKFDVDHNGELTDGDMKIAGEMLDIELREQKAATQKRMAWGAMLLMAVFTSLLFSPMISDSRVVALSNLLGLFYIAQAGIVGAYMGVTAWMANSSMGSRYYPSMYARPSIVQPGPDDDDGSDEQSVNGR